MTDKYRIDMPPVVNWPPLFVDLMTLLDEIEKALEKGSPVAEMTGARFDIVERHGMRIVPLPDGPWADQ